MENAKGYGPSLAGGESAGPARGQQIIVLGEPGIDPRKTMDPMYNGKRKGLPPGGGFAG
jgi:hypothetical protein